MAGFPLRSQQGSWWPSLLTAKDSFRMSFFESVFFVLLSSQEGAGEDIPIMLLGNKSDKEMERQVQKGLGERLAKVCSSVLSA